MPFNSFEFGVFFCLVWVAYWLLPHRAQNRWLLVASYVFYAAWDWRFLGLILFSTVVDYGVGIALSRTDAAVRRRRLLTLSLVANLGLLGAFKYAGFFADSLVQLLDLFGFTPRPFVLEVVLPVGISFYTFQTLSYTIDIFRRRIEPTRNFFDFALFVAFFPQLVAGPIERASRLLPQIVAPRKLDAGAFGAGCWLIFWGLFKKAVVGDNLAALVDAVYAPGAEPVAAEVVLATYAFAIQIYCDFSGYTDMARGVARLLGFDLMLNFRLPYFAPNPSEFWQRWHISLSTWLRDYLYIPLGGNREGRGRTYRNLLLTMLLGGLWHGAAWNFVVWGGYHGVLLAVHRAWGRGASSTQPRMWRRVVSTAVTFHLVCVGWLLFRATSLAHAGELLGRLAGSWELGLVAQWGVPFVVLTAPLLAIQIAQAASRNLNVVASCSVPVRALIYLLLGMGLLVLGEDFGQPFIYFQF